MRTCYLLIQLLRTVRLAAISGTVLLWGMPSRAASGGPIATINQLKKLSLDELLALEITSVSRREERAVEAAAAVQVITEEDLRRSGARNLPEALRLAPNLQVAQATSRAWAISARGFNATFSNKLLVLIDGRTVYSPLFSGVFWHAQDTFLEDIDRIEVISGPGATLWGANAVNGVISINTKNAKYTQGGIATVSIGSEERFAGGFRYGAQAKPDMYFRIYGKYFERDDSVLASGESGGDAWQAGQGGFRLDWEPHGGDTLTVQGDLYDGHGEQIEAADLAHSGGNLLARWTRHFAPRERLRVQTYYDRTRQFAPGEFQDTVTTYDIDTQYERDFGAHHHLMAGGGFRFIRNRNIAFPGFPAFLPATLDRQLFSAFVQDEISLVEDWLKLTLGSKFEHNDYTGFEFQPSGRVAWTGGRHFVWGAISRAVRTPSRFDRHLFFPVSPPFLFAGGPNFRSEELIAYELGWRVQPRENLYFSTTAFFHDYDDIRSMTAQPPFVVENNVEGEIGGIEVAATWQVARWWRLSGGYTHLQEDLRVKPGREDRNLGQGEAFDPKHQLQLRSSFDLPRKIEFDVWTRYVGRIGSVGRGFGEVPGYVEVDARIGWSVNERLDIALIGQNLINRRHAEFGSREIERSVYGKVTLRF